MHGVITAMITPFRSGEIDFKGLQRNIQHQIASGVDGILLLGTTGEAPTLSKDESEELIRVTIAEVGGRVPVMVGTGTNVTKQTIENTEQAAKLGADAALIITPYYNRPTQEGIYQHMAAIADATDLPLWVYNNPERTTVNTEIETLARIATLPSVVGIKEASADMSQIQEVIRIGMETGLAVMSGNDALTLPSMALGSSGIISIASNLIPNEMVQMTKAALEGHFKLAQELHHKLVPLFRAATVETNPIPIKAMMRLRGMPAGGCRLPLCGPSTEHCQLLNETLKDFYHGQTQSTPPKTARTVPVPAHEQAQARTAPAGSVG